MISTKRKQTFFRGLLKPVADQNDEIRKLLPGPFCKDTREVSLKKPVLPGGSST